MEADGGGGITEQPFGFSGKLGHTSLPGLQDLEVLSEAKVKQRWPGCLELCNIFELQNKYDLLGPDGQKILFLREDSTCFMRWCCGKTRALSVIFEDSRGDEVLRLERPLRCSDCCCDFCYPDWTQVIFIYSGSKYLGKVTEQPHGCSSKHLEVWNDNEQQIFDIRGPLCPISCGESVPFPIENMNGIQVGEISKQWRGCGAEMMTDTDTFKIEFPDGTDVTQKAILLGATMLVDYMFFEKDNNHDSSGDY